MVKVLFFVLFVAIAINLSFCAILDSYEEEDPQNPLQQAMAVFDMISRINDMKGRAIKAFPDPVKALAELSLFGAFKLGFFLFSALIVLSGLFPTFLATLGISSPFLIRSVTENFGELKNLNYEMVSHSIRSLPEKSFEALDVKGEDCRCRAVCEMGGYGAKAFPTGAGYVRAFGNKLNFSEKYLVAAIKGLGKEDCAQAYKTCTESPFKKLSYLSTYNIF